MTYVPDVMQNYVNDTFLTFKDFMWHYLIDEIIKQLQL